MPSKRPRNAPSRAGETQNREQYPAMNGTHDPGSGHGECAACAASLGDGEGRTADDRRYCSSCAPEGSEPMRGIDIDSVGAPHLLYETTIIVWSEFDPQKVELDDQAREACQGEAICTSQRTRRCAVALAPDAARSFFGRVDEEDRCEGCGGPDITSCPCLVCETCLSSFPGNDEAAREAGWTIQRDAPDKGAPWGTLRRVGCNGNASRASSACHTHASQPCVTLAPVTEADRPVIAAWLEDPDAQRWAGGGWLAEPADHTSTGQGEGAALLARSDGEPVAVINASPGASSTVLALVVDPARRGEGIGTSTLEAVVRLPQYSDSVLSCEIAAGNAASRRAFERAGFVEVDGPERDYVRYERNPTWR